MVTITRQIKDVTINPLQYLLHDDGEKWNISVSKAVVNYVKGLWLQWGLPHTCKIPSEFPGKFA